MRILIVGAGALGGLVGAWLTRAGEVVTLLEKNPARARLLERNGLEVTRVSDGSVTALPVHVVGSAEGLPRADLVFIAVKAYQTADAVRAALPAAGPETLFLSIQNGIGNTEVIGEMVGRTRVLCGIIYHSVQHAGPGRVRFREGIKPIQIAPLEGAVTPAIAAIGEAFARAGLATDVVGNIEHAVWQKLLHNAVINPVSALTGLTCRELAGDDDLLAFMRELCEEIVAVMRARGVPIVNEADPFQPLLASLAALGNNRPSMWQDLMRGVRTEIDALNGGVVAEAARLGLTAPRNSALVRFVRSRERHAFLDRQALIRGLGLEAAAPPVTEPPAGGGTTARAARSRPSRPPAGPPFESTRRLRELVRDYYRDLDAAANDSRRHVAACSSLAPVELVRAFGITPYFPEHHAALISARHESARCIAASGPLGFSQFSSSAMRCDLGALVGDISPLGAEFGISGPPRPDLVLCSTNTGHELLPWFEFYGTRYGVPVTTLHPPPSLHHLEPGDLHAVMDQVDRLIGQVSRIAGPLDRDRLRATIEQSEAATRLWAGILELGRAVPAPITMFEMLLHLAPMVLLRGTVAAVDYYRLLRHEVEDRVARGIASVPGESLRFYWDGPPIWHAIGGLASCFAEFRAAVVASTFGDTFTLPGFNPDEPVEGLARAYATVFSNRSDETKSFFLAEKFVQYSVDAAAYHDCRTTPAASHVRYGLPARAERLTRVPRFVIESDSHDERVLALDRLRRQLAEFVETHGDAIRSGSRQGAVADG